MPSNDIYEGLGPRVLRPMLNPYLDLATAKLTPVEGFVLSRIDGLTSYRELCMVTGLGDQETLRILRAFRETGIVLNPGETPQRVMRERTASGGLGSPPPRARAMSDAIVPLLDRLDDKSPIDPADLIDGPDLDSLLKTKLLRVHRRLSKLDGATLLGVKPDDDLRSIKKAYFMASKELHPDRFYGKKLGAFRQCLEDIFKRCAQAFNDLEAAQRKRR